MSDGANLGVSAGRALRTVIGGEGQPTEDERATVEQMEATIRATPLPVDFDRSVWGKSDDAYSMAANSIAHAFLVLADEDPEILTRELFYPDDYEYESMRGKKLDQSSLVWDAMMARWPDADDKIGGASGFMVGWAFNAAATIKGLPPAPNPAVMTIEVGDRSDA